MLFSLFILRWSSIVKPIEITINGTITEREDPPEVKSSRPPLVASSEFSVTILVITPEITDATPITARW